MQTTYEGLYSKSKTSKGKIRLSPSRNFSKRSPEFKNFTLMPITASCFQFQ